MPFPSARQVTAGWAPRLEATCHDKPGKWAGPARPRRHRRIGRLALACIAGVRLLALEPLAGNNGGPAPRFKRLFNLLDATSGPGKRHGLSGREGIELAWVRLYRATGEAWYLRLVESYFRERGKPLRPPRTKSSATGSTACQLRPKRNFQFIHARFRTSGVQSLDQAGALLSGMPGRAATWKSKNEGTKPPSD